MTSSGSNKFLLFFIILACVSFFRGYSQRPDLTSAQSECWKPAFSSSFDKGLYKARLEIGKTKLSGMFFMKRTSASSIRIVFTNEIGMTFFDLELTDKDCKVHAVFPSMNRKSFLAILEEDLRIMLFRDPAVSRLTMEKIHEDSVRTYRTKSKRGNSLYFVRKESHQLYRHKSAKSLIQRTEIRYTYGEPEIPMKVYIVNPTIRLHIYMNLLNK